MSRENSGDNREIVFLHEEPGRYIPVVAAPSAQTPMQWVAAISELTREHGPILAIEGAQGTYISATGADVVRELSDDTRFCKHLGSYLVALREFTGNGLFTAFTHEENWATAHTVLMPGFALSSLRIYHPVMAAVAGRLLSKWDRCATTQTPVDVTKDMTAVTLDTIGLAGFGFDFRSFTRPGPHPFVTAMFDALRCAEKAENGRTNGPLRQSAQVANAVMSQIVDEVIALRNSTDDRSRNDLLGLMLHSANLPAGLRLTGDDIRNQVITFLVAGHETTSGALSFALYYLLKNPLVLARAQQEVDELWGQDASDTTDYGDVTKLRYVTQVLNESLRLWPTAPGFAREARHDTTLCGYPVQAGQAIFIDLPAAHRDPVFGDNPELFDPDRFSPGSVQHDALQAFKPFGTGERACIGRQFAMHEATMLLGLLIHRYRFIDYSDYQLAIKQTLTIKPENFRLKLIPRTPADRRPQQRPRSSLAATASGNDTKRATPQPVASLQILYGSSLGVSREIAHQIACAASEFGMASTVVRLEAAIGQLRSESPVIVVTSTYNGQPTDDAADFVSWLNDPSSTLDNVSYAVVGVGDSAWAATYQQVPTLIDQQMHARGGRRILQRAALDVSADLTSTLESYTTALRAALAAEYSSSALLPHSQQPPPPRTTAVIEARELCGDPRDSLARHHNLTPMTVLYNQALTPTTASGPGKRALRLHLPTGATYRSGDHLAVLPANDPFLVESTARSLGVNLQTHLMVHSDHGPYPAHQPISARQLLTYFVELSDTPSRALLQALSQANPCPPEKTWLQSLVADCSTAPTLQDLLQLAPASRGTLTWAQLVELLPLMRPRYYSIASSPRVSPNQVDLIVSPVPQGTASTHLHQLTAGDTLHTAVRSCRHALQITHHRNIPLIMIAAGAGLAPFRAAIADRRALRDTGAHLAPSLLYYGCRNDTDYLYRDELTAAHHDGLITLQVAFSRPGRGQGSYVQDLLLADTPNVRTLIDQGARIHVCGDGAAMAPSVREAFQTICHDTASNESARHSWTALLAENRYSEDVYNPASSRISGPVRFSV